MSEQQFDKMGWLTFTPPKADIVLADGYLPDGLRWGKLIDRPGGCRKLNAGRVHEAKLESVLIATWPT